MPALRLAPALGPLTGLAALVAMAVAAPLAATPAAGLKHLEGGSAHTRVDLITQCWRTPSGRHRCRTVYVNPNKIWNPDRYKVGSTAWWRAMDRQGRGGFRP